MPQTFTNLHGGPITDPNLWERMTMGSPQLNPLVRGAIAGVPYAGPVYAGVGLINKIAHWLTPQTGAPSGGPSPSLSSSLPANLALSPNDPDYGNPNYIGLGDPVATPSQPGTAPAQPATAPVTPSNQQPATPGYYMPGIADMWNASRGAFSPTYQQLTNPGSAIGPLSTGFQQPGSIPPNMMSIAQLRNTAGLGTANPFIAGIPAEAAANTASIYRKNLI